MEVREVDVPMGGTGCSNVKISTYNLGPCIAFLLTFKHNGENTAVLTHYVHSMQNKRKTCGLIGKMIQLIDLLVSQIFLHYSAEDFTNDPGESIRPADPVVFNRTRIGFHRNPTFFIKNRSDPTEFLSDSFRSDSDADFVGI